MRKIRTLLETRNIRSARERVFQYLLLEADPENGKVNSKRAHSRLGLTEEMKQMCSAFENEAFKTLGFGFHESADRLGEELKTGDITRALQAMNRMMGYCVSCHKVFKQ